MAVGIFIPVVIIVFILVFICVQNQSDNKLYQQMSCMGGGEHKFTVQEPWFNKLKSGEKDVEGRLKKGRFEHIKDGDEITWVNKDTNEEIKTTVIDHKTYDNISDMIKGVGHKKLLPGTKSNQEAQEAYDKFYSPDKQKENKAIAIYLKKTK